MTRSPESIDPAVFRSSERAQAEWDQLWTKTWQMGPRVEELQEAGDAIVHSFGPESLIFLRDDSGEIRGFFNVCPHRGNRLLLTGDGPAYVGSFNCAFHGWRFGKDGNVEHIPCREHFDPETLTAADTSLGSFRVEAWAGWIWFTLDPEAPDLSEYLGPLGEKLDAYQMERAHIVDYVTIDFAANWKMVLDAFNESYHFQALHQDILSWGNENAPITLLGLHSMMSNEYGRPSALYPEQETLNPALEALLAANGIAAEGFSGSARDVRDAVQAAKRDSQDDSIFPYSTLSDAQLSDAFHYLLFPAVHFNLFPEFYVAMRYRPHPCLDPERMYFDFILCVPLEDGEEPPEYAHRVVKAGSIPVAEMLDWKRWTHPVVEQVLSEDISLIEQVQAGSRSMAFKGPILSRDERRLVHFHRNIDALVEGDSSVSDLIASLETEEGPDR